MESDDLREMVVKNKGVVMVAFLGLLLILSSGVFWYRSREGVEVEIITEESGGEADGGKIWVDIQGAVEAPGVYELAGEARVKDALLAAGGLSSAADRSFVARYINLAQKVTDGIKIYIPKEGESGVEVAAVGGEVKGVGSVNINSASKSQLEGLWGVGSTRAEAIIAGRPYKSVDELIERKIVPSNVFEKIRAEVSVY